MNTPPHEPICPPENRALAAEIRKHGCTLHPFLTSDREREAEERARCLHGTGARLPSVFTRRLWERNYIIAALCSRVFCVESRERITGGTAWGCCVARRLGRRVVRVDAEGRLYPDPPCDEKRYFWEPEYPLREDLWRDLPGQTEAKRG